MKSYSSQLISRLLKDGWYIVAQEGSHVQLKHVTKPGKITIPHPRKDIAKKTLYSIAKHTGLTFE